jgi:ELWxxDGT repeat protein
MLDGYGGPRSLPAQAPRIEPLEPRTHLAALPVLHDLNPKLDGADPQPGVTIGNTLYFTAHSDLGRELWKTDGTPKGTRLVRDLAPGPDSSNPQLLIDVNGTLFFTTTESDRSSSLWTSDGTPDGTRRLFTADGNIGEARAGLGKLFFTVSGDAGTDALWVTDGTESGTRTLVPDDGDWTRLLVEYRGRFLFASGFWTRGWKIHWTDGMRDGTERVPFFVGKKPMYQFMSGMGDLAVSGWFVANFIVHEGDLYLHRGHDDGYGRTTGLWRTDLKRAVQLFPNADKTVQTWKPAKAPLYFHGPDAPWWGSGGEVWRTDGTTQGTRRLKDVRPGPSDSNPKLLDGPLQPNLRYYFASSKKSSQELWITDGTTDGTRSLLTLGPTANWYGVYGARVEAVQLGKRLLFANDTPEHGRELWISNGKSKGTTLLRDFTPGRSNGFRRFLGTVNGKAVLVAEDAAGEAIYVSNGKATGTRALRHLATRTAPSNPAHLTDVNGTLYFATGLRDWSDPDANLSHLWKGDGTRAGSTIVKAFRHAIVQQVTRVGEQLYLSLQRPRRNELWVSDGTSAGTRRLAKGTGMTFTEFNEELFFATTDRRDQYRAAAGESMALFRTDGTSNGTELVRRFPLADIPRTWAILKDRLLFVAADDGGQEMLWSSDGTSKGTISLAPSNNGSPITVDGTRVFFTGSDATNGMELWVTDGTAQGSRMIKNMRVAALNAMPEHQVLFKDSLYFTAYGPDWGRGLWRTDGTEAGTELLLHPISVEDIAVMGDHLYFTGGYGGKSGLWKSDGTAAGTELLLETGVAYNRHSDDFRVIGGMLYFSAHDQAHGQEPWRSDGTRTGTAMLADLSPGSASSAPLHFTRFSDKLILSADDGLHGREVWEIPID